MARAEKWNVGHDVLHRFTDGWRLLARLCLLVTLPVSSQVLAEPARHCDGLPVEVAGGDAAIQADVCTASAATLRYLETLGLEPIRTIRIELADHAIAHEQSLAYGLFNGDQDRLELMSLQAITAQQPQPALYGLAIDDTMYAGLVAHELAHAVAQQHRKVETIGVAAQEYFAYAVQLAILPEPLRLEIVGTAGVGAWESGDTVSQVYLGLNVHRFAVKSYLHLDGQPDSSAFVQKVLASRGWSFQAE